MIAMPRDDGRLRVLFAGGGVATFEAVAALRAWAPGLVAPIVVAPSDRYTDRPLLVGEPFGYGPARSVGAEELCLSLGATFLHDAVCEVDDGAHTVRTAGGSALPYDVLVVASGARPYPAFADGVTFDRETSPADFDDLLADARGGFAPRIAIVVPDGIQWTLAAYELALLTSGHVLQHRAEALVSIVSHEAAPLAAFGSTVSGAVATLLDDAGIVFDGGQHADVLSAGALRAGARWIPCDRIVALPQLAGSRIAGLPHDLHGFLPTDAHGRVPGLVDVYAAGDVTTQPIKQGGLAAQQGVIVAARIAAGAGADVPAVPAGLVLRGMLRTPAGPWFLRAELDDVERTSVASREPLWWPPTKIASRWLSSHLRSLDTDPSSGLIRAART
jgi:sulfide:quinone oxidoreductase